MDKEDWKAHRLYRPALLVLTCCLSLSAGAEVFYCERNGVKAFQDKPCANATTQNARRLPPNTVLSRMLERIDAKFLEIERDIAACEAELSDPEAPPPLLNCQLMDSHFDYSVDGKDAIGRLLKQLVALPSFQPSNYSSDKVSEIITRKQQLWLKAGKPGMAATLRSVR